MKIKRKIQVFSLIVQRVAESRFPEIARVCFPVATCIQLVLHPDVKAEKVDGILWPYFHRLAEEFAEPGRTYHFELWQSGDKISTMTYNELHPMAIEHRESLVKILS